MMGTITSSIRASALAGALLAGCASLDAGLDSSLEVAEGASHTLTTRALSWICNRISVREWRETFGRQRERVAGWTLLCGQSASAPPVSESSLTLSPRNTEKQRDSTLILRRSLETFLPLTD